MRNFDLEALKVLFVDDNRRMQAIVKAILKALRIRNFRISDDIAEALTEVRQWHPDILITGLALQTEGGLDLARRLRRDGEGPDRQIPIILLTDQETTRQVIAARKAGVDEVLAKPVSIRALHSRIAALIQDSRAPV